MHKIEHEWCGKIIGRYDINMTCFSFMMSYRDVGDSAKVSQNNYHNSGLFSRFFGQDG